MGRALQYVLGIGGGMLIGGAVEAWTGTVLDWRWWVIAIPACAAWGILTAQLGRRAV